MNPPYIFALLCLGLATCAFVGNKKILCLASAIGAIILLKYSQ